MVHYYGFNGLRYHVPFLWELTESNPIVLLTPQDLELSRRLTPWRYQGKRIGPEDILQGVSPRSHLERIQEADLNYPILVDVNYQVIDGFHRLTKALMQKEEHLCAKIVSPDQLRRSMFLSQGKGVPKHLYHVSIYPYHQRIPLGQAWGAPGIFGTPYLWMALLFGARDRTGQGWTDEFQISFREEKDQLFPEVKELVPGAVKKYLTRPVYLYVVSGDEFQNRDGKPSYSQFMAREPVEIIQTEIISDPGQVIQERLGQYFQQMETD